MRFYPKTLFNSHWGESVSFQADNALMLDMAFQGLDQLQAEVAWKTVPQQDRLAEALFAGTRHYEVQLHFNKGLAGAPEDGIATARGTAMNPAVLDAFALAIIAGGDPHAAPGFPDHEPNLAAGRKAAIAITAAADELRSIVPEAGAYVPESNFFDKSRNNRSGGRITRDCRR